LIKQLYIIVVTALILGAQARAAITDFLADVRSRAAGLARDLAGQDGSRGGTQA